ncbi:hypothetical protein ACH5RR_034864 [Cinchona calisaya]|uniref:Uncharacterized protein n=1 Tax=Cinchona calisaya TaxID=153742 RepID=A0ABD2YHJ2_9GENT
MLKQSSIRNQRLKGSKVKLALQICLLIAICMWLLYQAKQFNNRKVALVDSSEVVTEERKNEYPILKLGRKNLNPRLNELAAEFQKHQDEEMEFEDEENKLQENEEDEGAGGNGELNVSNQEKNEEGEHEQLDDLIDEDDKEE